MIEKIQIIHGDFEESFKEMSYESVGRVLMSLIAFAKDEDPEIILGEDIQAKTIFPAVKRHVIRNEEYRRSKSEAGKRGGGQFGNSNAKKTNENEQKRAKTSKNEQKRTPNLTLPNLTNNKRLYGECQNVLLTDEEYQKVKDQGLLGLVEELSFYIAGSGKSYKSHYAVIRQWAIRKAKETKVLVAKPTQFNTGLMQRPIEDYDLDKLIKN